MKSAKNGILSWDKLGGQKRIESKLEKKVNVMSVLEFNNNIFWSVVNFVVNWLMMDFECVYSSFMELTRKDMAHFIFISRLTMKTKL